LQSPYLTIPTRTLATAFHPMFALYAGVLTGAALIFDLFYLIIGGGILMAALYTVPVTAGLVACLLAAADELRLDRAAVGCAIQLAVAAGLTNALYLGALGRMFATTPTTWLTGVLAILLSTVAVAAAAISGHLIQRLAHLASRAPSMR
jgi:hypothetical protein